MGPAGKPFDTMVSGTVVQADPGGPFPPAPLFEDLLRKVLQPAFTVALSLTRERADAEDLVQEAALRAFRHFGTFAAGSNFRAWFMKILLNCFRAKYRQRKRRPETIDLDDTPDLVIYGQSIASSLPYDGEDPASSLFDRLGSEQVTEAIQMLPGEYREVATLYFMQDLSYQDIAAILDCPVGTVRSRLHRGRKMLQKALWHLAEERGIVDALAGEVTA